MYNVVNLSDIMGKHICRLQRVQRALARVVMQQAYRSSSSTELLKQLHWLPIEWRIRFKLATSTYKTLHTGHPPYLTDLLQYHKSSVSTRSSTSQLLAIPWHNLSFGSRSFRVSALRIWNSLIPRICQCQTLATFRCHLQDPLLSVSLFCHLASIILCALILSKTLALYKSFTYLLTYVVFTSFCRSLCRSVCAQQRIHNVKMTMASLHCHP